jgi:hypothetical protein
MQLVRPAVFSAVACVLLSSHHAQLTSRIEHNLTSHFRASYAIYGTPEPVLESIASQASAQYEDTISLAKEQFSKASVKVAGTPKPAYEEALSSIESAYSESLSLASAKLDSVLGHTASITNLWARPTQGTYESISSAASVRLQQGLGEASAQ